MVRVGPGLNVFNILSLTLNENKLKCLSLDKRIRVILAWSLLTDICEAKEFSGLGPIITKHFFVIIKII